jgi:hypothetical protein
MNVRIIKIFTLLALVNTLSSCELVSSFSKSQSKTFEKLQVITLLAPVGENQQELALTFLGGLEKNLYFSKANYSYLYACKEGEKTNFFGNIIGSLGSSTVGKDAVNWLKQDQRCDTSIRVIEDFIQNLDDLTQQDKQIIVFMQIPWKSKLDLNTKRILKNKFKSIKHKEKILMISGFGESGDLGNISDVFQGANVIPFAGSNISEINKLPRTAKEEINKKYTH